jgi:predicted outer membrane repeat protein
MTRLTRRVLSALTALAMVGTLFVGAPAPVYAADPAVTYYVAQTGEPDGDGSSCADPDFVGGDTAPIALAVDLATNGDTIYICAGTYAIETTILFGGELLALQGAGRGVTILDGGSTFTAEGANNGDGRQILTSSTALTVSGLTFHGGYSATQGGAIYATTVTATNSTFTGNRSGLGGAIYATTVTATTSTFTDNNANDEGGAIYATTVTATNSTFTGNSSEYGGAIKAATIVTATNSTFTNNSADLFGGAIDATTVTAITSTFTGNNAALGGAVFANTVIATSSTFNGNSGGAVDAGTVTATNSTFTGNSSTYGGAINAATTVTANRSTFIGNSANFEGGAIYASTATVTASTFTGNSAIEEGGAILVGNGSISRSRFTRNSAGEHGGAVLFYAPNRDALRELRGNTFMRNSALAGGAITFGPCGTPSRSEAARVQRANRFSGNRATEQRRTNNIERLEGGCG